MADRCPTCGSDKRPATEFVSGICPDPWHSPACNRCPTCGSAERSRLNVVGDEPDRHLCRDPWHTTAADVQDTDPQDAEAVIRREYDRADPDDQGLRPAPKDLAAALAAAGRLRGEPTPRRIEIDLDKMQAKHAGTCAPAGVVCGHFDALVEEIERLAASGETPAAAETLQANDDEENN